MIEQLDQTYQECAESSKDWEPPVLEVSHCNVKLSRGAGEGQLYQELMSLTSRDVLEDRVSKLSRVNC